MNQFHDVVIVGAGPAGSALAILLARRGIDVLLLEKHEFPRDKVCGDFVSPRGLRKLAELGCYEQIAERAYLPVNRSFVYLDRAELSRGDFPALPEHPPYGNAIPRLELDEIMFRQAQREGASTRERCVVSGVTIERDGVTVTADLNDSPAQIHARIVVGADGANSAVARSVNLQMRDERYVQLAMRSYCKGLPLEDAVLYFEEAFFPGFGWIFPIRPNLANIGVGMVKEPMKKDGIQLRAFFERMIEFTRHLARQKGVRVEFTQTAGWPIKTYGGARRNFFERGLLIGDAGCFVDPISGEGIPLALETAEMAAVTICDALESGDCSEAALSSYERRWRQHFDPDLGVSDMIVSMIRNRHLVKLWIQWLKVMGMTAAEDAEYARRAGGILAGLVPNREGFSPYVVWKSIAHGPSFWMKVANVSATSLPRDLVRNASELLRWELDVASAIAGDPDWFRNWLIEIGTKQAKVMRSLSGSAVGQTREFPID
ncbi:MAG: NAD(P)/FAD-dependent oxidoreductase [Woeseiaceae bacterium]|jgi:menaquinone-9 beta-reductase